MMLLWGFPFFFQFFFVFQEGGFAAEHGISLRGGGPGTHLHWLSLAKLDSGEQAGQGGGACKLS